MKNTWQQSGNTYSLREVSQQIDLLPKAIYFVRFSPMVGFYLEQTGMQFPMPEKIYGVSGNFVDRVLRTWEHTNSNLGVLLNGIRGTGKTVSCEMLSNQIDIPTLVVDTAYDGLAGFISEIQQDVVVFFDEFEKVFPKEYGQPSKLLMLMDGVMKSNFRKLFLLTTNDINIDPNMIQRPGRIRYLKTYGNLEPDAIREILKDKLTDPARFEPTFEFIAELELITVDIVTAICNEVNIHNENPDDFKHIFNVKKIAENHAVFEVQRDASGKKLSEKLVAANIKISPYPFNKDTSVGDYFYVSRKHLGTIEDVLDWDLISVQPDLPDDWKDGDPDPEVKYYRIETRSSYNRVFGRTVDFAYVD